MNAKVFQLHKTLGKVYELVLHNSWDYYFTPMIDPKFVDGKDIQTMMAELVSWFENKAYNDGLRYLLIPDYCDRSGVHLHVLINDVLSLEDTDVVVVPGYRKPLMRATAEKKGIPLVQRTPVYNCVDWQYGDSTVIPLHVEPVRIAIYMSKFITEENMNIFGDCLLYFNNGQSAEVPADV